jgi:hypothetical protein
LEVEGESQLLAAFTSNDLGVEATDKSQPRKIIAQKYVMADFLPI